MDNAATLLEGGSRSIIALAAVLGLALLLAWSLRRAGLIRPAARTGRLEVTGVLALDGRTRLVLARLDDREHLLAIGPAGVSLIESRAAPARGGPEGG